MDGCSPHRFPSGSAPFSSATAELAERFTKADRTLYLVGGSVRDALFPAGAAAERDFDLTTNARPDEIERLVRGWASDVWTQGARFGTIGCRRDGQLFEITTHRAEVYVPDSRKPEVTFGDDIELDLLAARLHHQRAGAAPARHGAGRPLRRLGRPGRRPPAHPARPGGLLR